MDMGNRFLIGVVGDNITFLIPPKRMEAISKRDALLLAAWIVALAEDKDGEFNKILHEVREI